MHACAHVELSSRVTFSIKRNARVLFNTIVLADASIAAQPEECHEVDAQQQHRRNWPTTCSVRGEVVTDRNTRALLQVQINENGKREQITTFEHFSRISLQHQAQGKHLKQRLKRRILAETFHDHSRSSTSASQS